MQQSLSARVACHVSVCREIRKVLSCEVVRLDTKPVRGGGGNTQIIVAWVPYKTVVPTLLFSHGNAVDLGQMLPFYRSAAGQSRAGANIHQRSAVQTAQACPARHIALDHIMYAAEYPAQTLSVPSIIAGFPEDLSEG